MAFQSLLAPFKLFEPLLLDSSQLDESWVFNALFVTQPKSVVLSLYFSGRVDLSLPVKNFPVSHALVEKIVNHIVDGGHHVAPRLHRIEFSASAIVLALRQHSSYEKSLAGGPAWIKRANCNQTEDSDQHTTEHHCWTVRVSMWCNYTAVWTRIRSTHMCSVFIISGSSNFRWPATSERSGVEGVRTASVSCLTVFASVSLQNGIYEYTWCSSSTTGSTVATVI